MSPNGSRQVPNKKSNDDVLSGINTAVSPMRNTTANDTTKKKKNKYDLGPSMKKALLTIGVAELLDVLRFHCLDLGCQHVRAKNFLSTGSLELNRIRRKVAYMRPLKLQASLRACDLARYCELVAMGHRFEKVSVLATMSSQIHHEKLERTSNAD